MINIFQFVKPQNLLFHLPFSCHHGIHFESSLRLGGLFARPPCLHLKGKAELFIKIKYLYFEAKQRDSEKKYQKTFSGAESVSKGNC